MFPTYKNLMRLLNSENTPKSFCYQFYYFMFPMSFFYDDRQTRRIQRDEKIWKEGERG